MKIKNQKIINELDNVVNAKYYDINFKLDNLGELISFLKTRKLELFVSNNKTFLLDVEFLQHEINLDCFSCNKFNEYGCCHGSPYKFNKKNKTNMEKYSKQIYSSIAKLERQRFVTLLSNGGFVSREGYINELNGSCAFLVNDNGWRKCAIHKYALENDIDKYDICPLSCLMFPLDIVILQKIDKSNIYYITSVVDHEYSRTFGRWGDYTEYDDEFVLKCLDKKCSDKYFKKKDYKPVYEVNKNLIIHEFGLETYNKIKQLLEV